MNLVDYHNALYPIRHATSCEGLNGFPLDGRGGIMPVIYPAQTQLRGLYVPRFPTSHALLSRTEHLVKGIELALLFAK